MNVVRERRTLAAQSGLSREFSKIYITPERGLSLGLSFRAVALYIQTGQDEVTEMTCINQDSDLSVKWALQEALFC